MGEINRLSVLAEYMHLLARGFGAVVVEALEDIIGNEGAGRHPLDARTIRSETEGEKELHAGGGRHFLRPPDHPVRVAARDQHIGRALSARGKLSRSALSVERGFSWGAAVQSGHPK